MDHGSDSGGDSWKRLAAQRRRARERFERERARAEGERQREREARERAWKESMGAGAGADADEDYLSADDDGANVAFGVSVGADMAPTQEGF